MVFTSYFGLLKKLDEDKFLKCSIARHTPEWANVDYEFKRVAPYSRLIKEYKAGEIDNLEYTSKYWTQLAGGNDPINLFDYVEVFKELMEDTGKHILLLCYEVPDDFCHRHLLANLFRDVTGYVIPELELDEQGNIILPKIQEYYKFIEND